MLSIRTDLSSLIAQNSLTQSTNKLNQAIERMTTGAKINHAKDNAANYSISTNMTTKMGAYMIAQDNVSIGMELVGTAESVISQMQDHAVRLRELSTQASNGTYGAQSLNAIQSEANARIAEITRLYLSSEYNGISLFDRQAFVIPDNLVKAGESGFIDETAVDIKPEYDGFISNPYTYTDSEVQAMASIDTFTDGASGEFKIEDAEDLARLAFLVSNRGYDTTNATFVLANDIDLSSWCATNGNWVPIGNDTAPFKGIFDGNGHVIKNLKIDNPTANMQALFGVVGFNNNSAIKNVGIENASINGGGSAAALVVFAGCSSSTYIQNCFSEGNVKTGSSAGGLIGSIAVGELIDCYSTASVSGAGDNVGGLVGYSSSSSSITNSYATGNVTGTDNRVGGLVGSSDSSITNSYATGNVTGTGDDVGGLVGSSSSSSITNSYATGNVTGAGNNVGGLVGYSFFSSITNSYATGSVSGNAFVGGLVGQVYQISGTATISSSYALGDVTGSAKSGSLIGGVINTSNGTSFGTVNISDCYTLDSGMDLISGCYKGTSGNPAVTYDMSTMLAGITTILKSDVSTNLQVGIMGDANSQISFNTNFKYDLSALSDIGSGSALNAIDDFISTLSTKEVELGSVSNRLESVLDEITIQYENLVSSRSTIRDADMAELSSTYIQQQILQEASSTLLATTKNIQYQNVLGLLQGLRG